MARQASLAGITCRWHAVVELLFKPQFSGVFMAHQLGLDSRADARWIALTQTIERGAGWLDQVLQRWP